MNWIQSLTVLFQDVLVFCALYVTLLFPDQVVDGLVPLNYLMLGILFLSLPLYLFLIAAGWYYDKKLRVWSADIVKETGVKFCVDIGHAIYSANHYQENALDYILKFIYLGPFMFHLGDGDFSYLSDVHKHLTEGDFPLEKIIEMIPHGSTITIETPKSDFVLLSEDLANLQKLKNLIRAANR